MWTLRKEWNGNRTLNGEIQIVRAIDSTAKGETLARRRCSPKMRTKGKSAAQEMQSRKWRIGLLNRKQRKRASDVR